jgi:site-specific DNA recombinase
LRLSKRRLKEPASRAFNGNKKRHDGIVLNETYVGIVVWNQVRMMKDPDTAHRISRANPPEEWERAEAPRLAIIDKALFDAALRR